MAGAELSDRTTSRRVFRSGDVWAIQESGPSGNGQILMDDGRVSDPRLWGSIMAHLHVIDPWAEVTEETEMPGPIREALKRDDRA